MEMTSAIERKEMREDEACSFAMSLTCGSVLPMVLKAVIELDVLEIIKRAGPSAALSPAQIAAQLPTRNPMAATMLDRMLRLLASHSILSCSVHTLHGTDGLVERHYGLSPVCQFLTKNEDGVTLGALCVLLSDKIIVESLYHLKDAVLDGDNPFHKAYGMGIFEYFGTDSRSSRIFNYAMSNHSIIMMQKILENYKGFQGLSSLVDIGGGIGVTLHAIVSKYPSIRGINFDLPHVIADAPTYTGVEHVVGDMFMSVPEADAMFMKFICHDWSDEHCIKLFKNCYAALPDHGKVIICDYTLPVASETSQAARAVFQYDVLMLSNCSGGKERTEQEFEALAKEAGFGSFKVACSAYGFKVMEILKRN